MQLVGNEEKNVSGFITQSLHFSYSINQLSEEAGKSNNEMLIEKIIYCKNKHCFAANFGIYTFYTRRLIFKKQRIGFSERI